MTYNKLLENLSDTWGISKKETDKILDAIKEEILANLLKGEKVNWANFFIMRTRIRKGRIVRNPRTKELMKIPDTRVIKIRISKRVKRKINER